MSQSAIPYCSETLNVVTGCSGDGCPCAGRSCWAETMCRRFPKLHQEGKVWPIARHFSQVLCHPEALDKLAHWRKPRVVLVSALGEIADKQVPADFILRCFEQMAEAKQHTFLVLTKHPDRLRSVLFGEEGNFLLGGGDFYPNIWLGATVTGPEDLWRVDVIVGNEFRHFVSYEPALGPLDLSPWLTERKSNDGCLNWVVAGCESGPGARPCDWNWLWPVREQCIAAGIPCYIKQERFMGKLLRHKPTEGSLPWTLAANRPRKPKAGAIR